MFFSSPEIDQMANGSNTNEWVGKLQDALTKLQISSANVEQKIDQLTVGMEKLEASMADMKNITSSQETRITLLEQESKNQSLKIPITLTEDLALIKEQLKNYQKFLWLVTCGVVGLIIKMIFSFMGA